MDILTIQQQTELLQTIGYTLTVDEKLRLKLAHLTILNSNQNIDELKFWGRIEAITKTYYVLLALRYQNSYEFPHKTFYWATSQDYEFKELPELLLQHEGLSQKYNQTLLSGDPNKILVNLEGEGEGQEGQPPAQEGQQGGQNGKDKKSLDEEEEEIKKVPKKNFTELHRLSHVIRSIENDVQIVPLGSYKINPNHELRPNKYFYGLPSQNARHPQNWLHFRSPKSEIARKNLDDDLVIFSANFLDSISEDVPQGSWSTQIDNKVKNVTVRSLKWLGYFAFHKLNSNQFGSVYIGDGIKNVDLSFMI